ncbi:hypothetical protein IAT38_005619 [Cryptococcus sp. DSM 104549]
MAPPPKPLKSAMKKPKPVTAPSGPSTSAPPKSSLKSSLKASGKPAAGKPKAKHSVSIAKKPQRLRGPDLESGSEGNASGFEESDGEGYEDIVMENAEEEDEGLNTDEEIERSKEGKPKKAAKRKRAPTTAEDFGATLTSLLADPLAKKSKKPKHPAPDSPSITTALVPAPIPSLTAPTTGPTPILALSQHKPPTKQSVSLEIKAKRALKAEKEEREDRARVKDMVEGWGGDGVVGGQEFEKGLRKTAQRGVIKLFNAILLASKNAEEATTSLSAQAKLKPDVGKKKEKDNILGRGGKEDVLTTESFLDMVRKGSSR